MDDGTGRLRGHRRVAVLALIALVFPMLVNCYGSFPLTRAVYRANSSVPTGILRTVVFWVFLAVPVYSTAALVDAIALNLIEFWTGAVFAATSVTDGQGNHVALTPSEDGREATLTVSRDGTVTGTLRLVRVDEATCELRGADGALVGRTEMSADGRLTITDTDGMVVGVLTSADIAAAKAAHSMAL